MNICRYCDKPVADSESVRTLSYWNQHEYVCHAVCNKEGERQEAIDCQVVDADCNDCKHFKRGELVKQWLSAMVNGESAMVLTNMGVVRGDCLRFNRPTEAFPHKSTGRECFEHRRL